ncbi:MAG: MotA/TolQ/ExbB proton channel family protein [Deltaproteobacteria bacterium]|jgi:biopolymer transport protein TolQ|nr:MotA/TolQ/ExbB proton channel family protein [Deltaproteobacteria bacterium]
MEIFSMIAGATIVVQCVLLALLIMSLSSWSLMIYKHFSLRRAYKQSVHGLEKFSEAKDLTSSLKVLETLPDSPAHFVARQGVAEYNRLMANQNSSKVIYDNVNRALGQGVSDVLSGLGGSISFLATCANTAPFIGLFGTVWGIMHSFHSIGLEGKASLATVAPGISEALIATAIGLFVAVPATIGYNSFLSRMGSLEVELTNFGRVFINRVQSEVDNNGRNTTGTGA